MLDELGSGATDGIDVDGVAGGLLESVAVGGRQHHAALRVGASRGLLPVAQVDGMSIAEANQRGCVRDAALHLDDHVPQEAEALAEAAGFRRSSRREVGRGHRAKGNVSRACPLDIQQAFRPISAPRSIVADTRAHRSS